ncbi:hypothetical protein IQ272_19025 [Chroococcidiopsidales cyanobacterium LEGE 13417]|nr:hypothetical protein [Chroococcidiopsidales cyanobacterium LEGE 13417]
MKHELVSHKKLQDTLSHRRFKVKSVVRERTSSEERVWGEFGIRNSEFGINAGILNCSSASSAPSAPLSPLSPLSLTPDFPCPRKRPIQLH